MIVWHVTTIKKFKKYIKTGFITPPVRAWENFAQAERMSKSTDRKVILRLKFPNDAEKLEGHFNQARVVMQNYSISNF